MWKRSALVFEFEVLGLAIPKVKNCERHAFCVCMVG